MKKNKVRVISATENISKGSEGILLESVFEGMAEYYSAELAEKVGRGMTENALKCKFNGGTVPIGYTINKDQLFEVDPVKAPYVVQAFEAYANGKPDFIAKLQIALKECYETEYWLELFVKSDILNRETAVDLYNQCGTIRRILIASINTAKENNK